MDWDKEKERVVDPLIFSYRCDGWTSFTSALCNPGAWITQDERMLI